MDWTLFRNEIPALKNCIYMNSGTEGPTPTTVLQAQLQLAKELAEQGPAAWPMLMRSDQIIQECRSAVAGFIGAQPAQIAITHNATEGINIVATGINWTPGDEVIISDLEHASGVLPWLQLAQQAGIRIINLEANAGVLAAADFAAVFTDRTRLVCMSHVSYSSGACLPVAEVSRLAAQRGIQVLVDGAQAVGQKVVDMQALQCDYYALPGQKWMMGPAGTGALYVRVPEALSTSRVGWASVLHDDRVHELQLFSDARRFELATVHSPSLAGWVAAMQFLTSAGISEVEQRISTLAATARQILAEVPGLEILGPDTPTLWSGLLPFRMAGHDPKTVVAKLWRQLRVVSRYIPNPYCVRLSLHAFTCEDELEQVAKLLSSLT